MALAVLTVVAVAKELSKPKDERTWHGTVAGFIPYELRFPTLARLKDVYWNPDGRLFGAKVFGVGWAVNVGAVVKRAGIGSVDQSLPEDDEPTDYVVE